MTEIELKRHLVAAASNVAKTNDVTAAMTSAGDTLAALRELLSIWTGEQVRIHVSAVGQEGCLDVGKRPDSMQQMDPPMVPGQPTTSLRWFQMPNGTYAVEMLIAGLPTEDMAHAAMSMLETEFCSESIQSH